MKGFITIFLNIIFLVAAAENQSVKSDSSNTTVVVFEDSKSTAVAKNKKGKIIRVFAKNNIKIGLFGPIYGQVPFYYERYIADWFTIQVGVGIATRDFLGDLYSRISFGTRKKYRNDITTWTAEDEYDVPDTYTDYQFRRSSIGMSASIAPRFYPVSNAFDGLYISPVIEYSIRNYKVQKVDEDGNRIEDDKQKERTNTLLFCIQVGSQYDFEPITLDWSFSVGIAKNNYLRQDIGYRFDEMGNNFYGNREIKYSRLNPYFKLNLDLGLTFGGKKKKKQSKL